MPAAHDNHGRGRKAPRTTVRWSPDEYRELCRRAKAAKLPVGEYLRRAALG